jgi:hypothetical protein
MSTRTNATISPDRPVGDPDHIAVDTVSSSGHAKRRQEEADTPHDGTGTGSAAAKVARLASAEEETKEQEDDETPDTSLTTEKIMNLIKDLWSDDEDVIEKTLTEITYIGLRDTSVDYKNELEMRGIGVHITIFQVFQKHAGCLAIQEGGIRALANLTMLMSTTKRLGKIGCVEVILASMEKYPESKRVQEFGCCVIGNLVFEVKDNAERFKISGGIAVVIAAMKAHPNSEKLQNHGCNVLENMSEWEEYRPLIVEAGGASAIAFALENSGHSQQLRQDAHDAMERLFKRSR